MDALATTIEEVNIDLAEVVLREFASESFEAKEGRGGLGAQGGDEAIESRFSALIAVKLGAPKQLQGGEIGALLEPGDEPLPKGFGDRRPADTPAFMLGVIVDVLDERLVKHTLDRALGNAREFGDANQGKASFGHDLDLVALEEGQHRTGMLRRRHGVSEGYGHLWLPSRGGQIFRFFRTLDDATVLRLNPGLRYAR
jgi:hypothetical protein